MSKRVKYEEKTMSDIFFYCLSCNDKITVDQLALLNEGKCPSCGSLDGFTTDPKANSEKFQDAVVLNDQDFLEKSF